MRLLQAAGKVGAAPLPAGPVEARGVGMGGRMCSGLCSLSRQLL